MGKVLRRVFIIVALCPRIRALSLCSTIQASLLPPYDITTQIYPPQQNLFVSLATSLSHTHTVLCLSVLFSVLLVHLALSRLGTM